MEILSLFSTNIITTFIEEDIDVEELKMSKVKFTSISPTDHNPQTPDISINLRVLKKYPKLEDLLLKKFVEIAGTYFNYKNDFAITTSWFTRVNKGQYSQPHVHKNSFWSGVYYFDDYSKDSASIEFMSPLVDFTDYYLKPDEENEFTATMVSIQPKKNSIVFFPSYIEHKVSTHKDNATRYSLPFNIVPIGKYGNGDSFYNTDWFE